MEYIPDIIELQSWLATTTEPFAANIWLATKYLSSPYKIWLATWKECGKPNIWD